MIKGLKEYIKKTCAGALAVTFAVTAIPLSGLAVEKPDFSNQDPIIKNQEDKNKSEKDREIQLSDGSSSVKLNLDSLDMDEADDKELTNKNLSTSLLATTRSEAEIKAACAQDVEADFADIFALDSSGSKIPFIKKNSGKEVYEIGEGYTSNDIKKLSVALKFEVKTASINRKIQGGDYFDVLLPESVTSDLDTDNPLETTDGLKIANVKKIPDDENKNGVRFTFTSEVDASRAVENISGNFAMVLNVKESAFGKDPLAIQIDLNQPVNQDIQVIIPEKTTVIDGIEKSGAINKTHPDMIDWTITVGAGSKGVSLKDVKIIDEINKDFIADTGDLSGKMGSKEINLKGVSETGSDIKKYQYIFGEDDKAPKTITYSTKVPAKTLGNMKEDGLDVVNNAKIELPEGLTIKEGGKVSCDATVHLSAPSIKKSGYPISSDELMWSIKVDATKAPVYKCDVIDTLSDQVSYIDGSIRIENKEIATDKEASSKFVDKSAEGYSGITFNKTKNAEEKEVLTVSFENGIEKGSFYTITFRTKVDTKSLTYTGADGSPLKSVKVSNGKYEVKTYFPTGTGDGPSIKYGYPEVTRAVYTAFLSKKVEKLDKEEGKITWSLSPSTTDQIKKFGIATIIDEIPAGLSLKADDVTVTYKGEAVTGENEVNVTVEDRKLTVKITQPTSHETVENDLSKYEIKYITRVDDYLSDNALHTYENKAHMEIDTDKDGKVDHETPVTSARTSLQNNLLSKKAEVVYDKNNQPYFHYTIDINKNKNSLENVKFTDDIKNTLLFGKDKDAAKGHYLYQKYYELALDSSKYQKTCYVADSTGKKIDAYAVKADNNIASINFGKISDSYTVHLYVAIDTRAEGFYDVISSTGAEGKVSYENTIFSDNTAHMTFTPVALDANKEVTARAEASEKYAVKTDMLQKSGQKAEGSMDVKWEIHINPAGAPLEQKDGKAVLVDTIPSTQSLDMSSILIEKYDREDGKNKAVWKDGEALGSAKITLNREKKRDGSSILTIELPSGNDEYYISYITTIVGSSKSTIENTAKFTWGSHPYMTEKTVTATAVSGGAATGHPHVVMTLSKVDAFASDTKDQVALQGAEYGIFTADQLDNLKDWNNSDNISAMQSNAVDYGWTDADGKLTLTGQPKVKYYIVEIREPGAGEEGISLAEDALGYVRDKKIYGPYNYETSGRYDIKPMVDGKGTGLDHFTDTRDTKAYKTGKITLNKSFEKSDANAIFVGTGQNLTGYQATYKLVMYPKADPNASTITNSGSQSKSIKLEVKKDAGGKPLSGQYVYSEDTSSDGKADTFSTDGADADGKATLTIENLPWGVYELREVSTHDGYAIEKEGHLFAVKRESSSHLEAENTATVVQGKDANNNILAVNKPINLVIEKKDRAGNVYKDKNTVFTLIPEKAGSTFASDSDSKKEISLQGKDTTENINSWSTSATLKNDSSYILTETVAPSGCRKVSDLKIAVDPYGTIKVTGKSGNDVSNYAKISNLPDGNGYLLTITDQPVSFTLTKQGDKTNKLSVDKAVFKIEALPGSRFAGKDDAECAAFATNIKGAESVEYIPASTDKNPAYIVTLRDSKGEGTSDSVTFDGIILCGIKDGDNISGGHYRLTELLSPAGYKAVSGKSIDLVLDEKGNISLKDVSADISTCTNNKIVVFDKQNSFSLVKRGENKRSVKGTKFELSEIDQDGNVITDNAFSEARKNISAYVSGAKNATFNAGRITFGISDTEKEDSGYVLSDPVIFNGLLKPSVATRDSAGNISWSNVHTYRLKETVPPATLAVAGDIYLRMDTEGLLYAAAYYDGIYSENASEDRFYSVVDNKVEITDLLNAFKFDVVADVLEQGQGTIYSLQASDYTTPIANVEFKLYKDKDSAISSDINDEISDEQEVKSKDTKIRSNSDGSVILQGLENGRIYYIKETSLPGYDKKKLLDNDTVYWFTIGADGKASDLKHFIENDSTKGETDTESGKKNTIVNQVVRVDATIEKVDATDTGKLIAGSTYGLYRKINDEAVKNLYDADEQKNGGLVVIDVIKRFIFKLDGTFEAEAADDGWVKIAEKTTDSAGRLTFSGLVTGVTYRVRELVAPAGSLVSKDPIQGTFVVDNDGKVTLTDISNGHGTVKDSTTSAITTGKTAASFETTWLEPPTQVRFDTVDESGKALSGASMHVEDMNGNVVLNSWTSGDGSDAAIAKGILVAGKQYKLVQDFAPDGYSVEEPIIFVVNGTPTGSTEADLLKSIQTITLVNKKVQKGSGAGSGIYVTGDKNGNGQVMLKVVNGAGQIEWIPVRNLAPKTGLAENHNMLWILFMMLISITIVSSIYYIKVRKVFN